MKKRCLLVSFALMILLSGCTRLPKSPEDMPPLTPCVVLVRFNGEAAEGVGIVLQPEGGETNSWSAGGKTDTEGKAILKTAGHYSGVVPGDYIISFQKHAPEEFRPDGMPLPAKSLLPPEFAPGRSKKTISVSKDQKEYEFSLP